MPVVAVAEISVAQRAHVLKTVCDLCVMARVGQECLVFPSSSSQLSSNLPAGRR